MRNASASALAIGLGVSATALADTPMSYMRTFGPAADPITALGWGLLGISMAVIVIIGALLVGGLFRRRSVEEHRSRASLAVARDSGGLAWIYVGVGVSTVVLMISAVWTFSVIAATTRPPSAPGLSVEVSAEQWWWRLRYASDDPAGIFMTANEIHIPVGQPVRFELASPDVIHSFWVPQLAGKTDVIPGQRNVAWLQANQPGVYRGQCGEYCGAQHAHMALVVVADAADQFTAWRRAQLQSSAPATAETRKGAAVFASRCGSCHTVRGSDSGGLVGPDLTHLMSRRTIAAGMLPNDREHLAEWIIDAQRVKPGARMPSIALAGEDLDAVLAYLLTLS